MKNLSNLSNNIITQALAGSQKLREGKVRCKTCGRMLTIDSAECLQSGWPKCCGYTMTLDGPEEEKDD